MIHANRGAANVAHKKPTMRTETIARRTIAPSGPRFLASSRGGIVRDGVFIFCPTFQISHAEDNADPQNRRLPALRCGGWLGSFTCEFTQLRQVPEARRDRVGASR